MIFAGHPFILQLIAPNKWYMNTANVIIAVLIYLLPTNYTFDGVVVPYVGDMFT